MRRFDVYSLAGKPVVMLWASQFVSLTGIEFYTVAIVWSTTSLVGGDAGYVSALQSGMLLIGSLFLGAFTDRCRPRTALLAGSIIRGVLLLCTFAFVHVAHGTITIFSIVITCVALATSIETPVLQATLPHFADASLKLQTINGIFDATRRLARILGPGLVALVSSYVAVGDLFAVTAVACFVSAALIQRAFSRVGPGLKPFTENNSVRDAITGGMRAIRGHKILIYSIYADFVGNFTWAMGLILGMTLYFRSAVEQPLAAFGTMMAFYGIGNLVANIVLANKAIFRPGIWLATAKLVFGGGIILLAFSREPVWIAVVACVTGINGPIENFAFLHVLQRDFNSGDLLRVYRLNRCAVFAGLLVGNILAPSMFHLMGYSETVIVAGAASAIVGLVGFFLAGLLPRGRTKTT